MAYVATVKQGERDALVAVCRYAPAEQSDVREMAVTIADEWRRSDLAKILMQHLIRSAKHYGIRELYAVELGDNDTMHDFAQEFGMNRKRDPNDATQVIYSLSL